MDNQQMVTFVVGLISVIVGAFVGGGAAVVVMNRVVRGILESPVLLSALETTAKSWPPEVRELLGNTGKLVEEVADDKPVVTVGEAVPLAERLLRPGESAVG